MLIKSHQGKLIIVPRHPERFEKLILISEYIKIKIFHIIDFLLKEILIQI